MRTTTAHISDVSAERLNIVAPLICTKTTKQVFYFVAVPLRKIEQETLKCFLTRGKMIELRNESNFRKCLMYSIIEILTVRRMFLSINFIKPQNDT